MASETVSPAASATAAARIAGMAQRLVPGLPPGRFGVAGLDRASLLFAHGPDVRFLAETPGRLVAEEGQRGLHSAAAALGLPVREEARILVFD